MRRDATRLLILHHPPSTDEHTKTFLVRTRVPDRSSLLFSALLIVWAAWLIQLPPRPDTWLVFASGLPIVAFASWIAARRAGESWRRFTARTVDFHVVWLALLFALAVQLEDAHGITTDGVTYFTQLRSVIFDGDLDVTREFAYLQQPSREGHVVPIGPHDCADRRDSRPASSRPRAASRRRIRASSESPGCSTSRQYGRPRCVADQAIPTGSRRSRRRSALQTSPVRKAR